MARNLDIEFPTGDPNSLICRWCKEVRVKQNDALLCRECDGGVKAK